MYNLFPCISLDVAICILFPEASLINGKLFQLNEIRIYLEIVQHVENLLLNSISSMQNMIIQTI